MQPAPLWVQGSPSEMPAIKGGHADPEAERCKVYLGFCEVANVAQLLGGEPPRRLVAQFTCPTDARLGAAAPSLLQVCETWAELAPMLELAVKRSGNPIQSRRLRAHIEANRATIERAKSRNHT